MLREIVREEGEGWDVWVGDGKVGYVGGYGGTFQKPC